MKSAISKYSRLAIALIPILFFNIGVQSFHDCNNLLHHHDETSFETGHDECLICEAKLHPFEDLNLTVNSIFESSYSINYAVVVPEILLQDLESASNKGPPALA